MRSPDLTIYAEGADLSYSVTAASGISFSATGGLTSTDIQAAIEELDSDKADVDQTMHIGTTDITINRASAPQALTGITSIDGSSASCVGNSSTATTLYTARGINGVSFNGASDIAVPSLWSNVVTKTSTYTASSSDSIVLCDGTSGSFDVDLPTAVGISGRVYTIKKVDSSANSITIDPNGSETIDGDTSVTISTRWNSVTVVSDGANWMII